MRAEILENRNKRDKLNEAVKELKQQREKAKADLHLKIEEIKKFKEEIKVLDEKKPSRSFKALEKEIASTEWKIQTSSLDLKDEKELVEEVKQLQTMLNIHKKHNQLKQKFLESRAEAMKLKANIKRFHEELTENAQKSQQIHVQMLDKIEKSKRLKMEADSLHALFLQAKEKAKPTQEEFLEISNQINMLKEEIQKEEDEEKKKSQIAIREELEKQAMEKLKRGEKLTWEEFQLLAEKGMIAQD
jgi:uncharacterized coiled-coil DUF342 family protein